MKKLIATLMALLLAVTCAGAEGTETTVHTAGAWDYRLLPDGSAEIVAYNGGAADVTIPAALDGHPVTAVSAWFGQLNSLYIPDSVTDVARIRSVVSQLRLPAGLRYDLQAEPTPMEPSLFPDEITDERMQQFLAAASKKDARTIKDAYRQVGVDPVTGKSYYKKADDVAALEAAYPALAQGKVVWILRKPRKDSPGNFRKKLEDAFVNSGYTQADLMADYEAVHGHAMPEAPWYQKELALPFTLRGADFSLSDGCEVTNLSGGLMMALTVQEGGVPRVERSGDFCYDLRPDGTAILLAYLGGERVLTVPDALDGHTVTAVGGEAFMFAEGLTAVWLPDTVTELSPAAFLCCASLTAVRVSPEHPTLASVDGVLFGKNTRTILCYPEGRTEESYQIPQGICAIAPYAFAGWSALNHVEIAGSTPDRVSFNNEDGLQAVEIPDSVTQIAPRAFYGNDSLRTVTIGAGVTAIGKRAFYDCDGLTEVTVPGAVSVIGQEAFFHCDALRTVVLGEGVTALDAYAFGWNGALESVTLPASMTEIGKYAFGSCTALEVINVPQGSFAAQYCQDNGLRCTYSDAND